MKRIVICCDGTWNSPDQQASGVPVPTNVTRFADSVLLEHQGIPQLLFYHPGIGSEGSWFKRVFDGYTGTGISRNILDAYCFLVNHYQPGDQLFLFGFSRGAFTVRSLAGFIRNSGLLRPDSLSVLDRAYRLYRARGDASRPRGHEATLFRRTYAVADAIPIEFVGVWDTVGSLGNPLLFGRLSPQNRFHDTDLSTIVRHAYQALAIDEKRWLFEACLWHQQPDARDQLMEQAWFPGVHCNVGGGYVDAGLSDVALEWLVENAKRCGLRLGPLHLTPNPQGKIRESWRGLYCLFPPVRRSIGALTKGRGPTNESLHPSVLARYRAEASYRPRNLEDYFTRHPEERPGA